MLRTTILVGHALLVMRKGSRAASTMSLGVIMSSADIDLTTLRRHGCKHLLGTSQANQRVSQGVVG